jgi:hypothetical protein
MATFQQYADAFNAYKASHPVEYDPTGYQGPQAEVSGYGGSQDAGYWSNLAKDDKIAMDWLGTLSPEQVADYAQATQTKDAQNHKSMPIMGAAILAAVATMGALSPAVMGGTGGSGLLGSTAGTGLGAGGSDLATSAAWGSGAGLGGDTLSAMGLGADSLAAGGAGMGGYSGLLTDQAPTLFNAAKDSALASQQLGYTGAELGGLPVSSPAVPTGMGSAADYVGLSQAEIDKELASQAAKAASGAQPQTTGLLDGSATELTPLKSLASTTVPDVGSGVGAASGLGGLLSGGLGDALKAAGVIGGAIAGSKEVPGETTTQKTTTDPRLDPYLYGDQGLFPQAQQWYGANKTGVNANRQAGWDTQIGLLTDPALQAQIAKLKLGTQGLLNSPVASNPFLKG